MFGAEYLAVGQLSCRQSNWLCVVQLPRRGRMLIADLTHGNKNVYQEICYRMGLNRGKGLGHENFLLIHNASIRQSYPAIVSRIAFFASAAAPFVFVIKALLWNIDVLAADAEAAQHVSRGYTRGRFKKRAL